MADSFIPGSDNTRALRNAFSRFATGVTVVTAHSDTLGPIGITANSFTSVSLDPPLLLWCPAKASRRHDAFTQAHHFALHVMGTEQDATTWAFANSAKAFEQCDCTLSDHGVPLIADCPVRFECSTRERIDAGDHTVIIGQIYRVTVAQGPEARVFLGGDYGRFTAEA